MFKPMVFICAILFSFTSFAEGLISEVSLNQISPEEIKRQYKELKLSDNADAQETELSDGEIALITLIGNTILLSQESVAESYFSLFPESTTYFYYHDLGMRVFAFYQKTEEGEIITEFYQASAVLGNDIIEEIEETVTARGSVPEIVKIEYR